MPSTANGLTPSPHYGVPRPCVGRTLQNLMGRTLPVQLRNLACFTGDTLYPHHDKLQNLFLMRLTAAARRGRPVRGATESKGTQRGRSSQSKHQVAQLGNLGAERQWRRRPVFCPRRAWEAREARQQSQILRAGCKAHVFSRTPLGPGPKPRRFFGYFCISTKVPRPGAKYPHPPSRPQAILPSGRRGTIPPVGGKWPKAKGGRDDSPCQGEMSRRDKRGRDKLPPRRPQGATLRAGRPEAAPYEALSQPVCRGRRPRRPLIVER